MQNDSDHIISDPMLLAEIVHKLKLIASSVLGSVYEINDRGTNTIGAICDLLYDLTYNIEGIIHAYETRQWKALNEHTHLLTSHLQSFRDIGLGVEIGPPNSLLLNELIDALNNSSEIDIHGITKIRHFYKMQRELLVGLQIAASNFYATGNILSEAMFETTSESA